MKKLYIWDELMTECRNYTLEMGTTNIINQEQAGKLGQNQQAVGKRLNCFSVKFRSISIYIYLERKNFTNTLWNTPYFNKSRNSGNRPPFNDFGTLSTNIYNFKISVASRVQNEDQTSDDVDHNKLYQSLFDEEVIFLPVAKW